MDVRDWIPLKQKKPSNLDHEVVVYANCYNNEKFVTSPPYLSDKLIESHGWTHFLPIPQAPRVL